MNVVYLDQNIVIDLVDHFKKDPLLQRAREVIIELVKSGHAVFPYSEIHLSESASMDFESRKRVGEFWKQLNGGYRFIEGKEIRSSQFLDVFHSRKIRFKADRVLYRDQLNFIEGIESVDPRKKISREEKLREVVAYWSSLKKKDIEGHVRTAEASASAKLVQAMLEKITMGEFPLLGELLSDHNSIASDISWEYHNQGYQDDALPRAIAFMRENALKVPSICVESVGLEALAEQFASDADRKSRRSVGKSQLGHDSNDLAALSNFVPYCRAGISDGNAITLIHNAYRKLNVVPPKLFRRNQLKLAVDFLERLPAPETKTNPIEEVMRTSGKSLILVPWELNENELITREDLEPLNGIQRQILPFGGLKVWSLDPKHDWSALLEVLERSLEELKRGVGNESTVYGGVNTGGSAQIKFGVRIPCGMVELARNEFETTFAREDSH